MKQFKSHLLKYKLEDHQRECKEVIAHLEDQRDD